MIQKTHLLSPFNIRAAVESDVALLASLGAETFAQTYGSDTKATSLRDYIRLTFGFDQQLKEFLEPHTKFYLGFSGASCVGYVKIGRPSRPASVSDQNAACIERIYLDKNHQAHGYREKLLRHACRWALGSYDSIWLSVWEKNQKAIGFYRRLGFIECGQMAFQLGDEVQNDLVMSRPINVIESWKTKNIAQKLIKPPPESLTLWKNQSAVTEFTPSASLLLDGTYLKLKLKGALKKTYGREAIVRKLKAAAYLLHTETAGRYSLIIFDAFRSLDTQRDLFNLVLTEVKKTKPDLDAQALLIETRKYVAHPDDLKRYPIAPHNSGGAVDLGIFDNANEKLLDMGTVFDDPSPRSRTDFFETRESGENVTDAEKVIISNRRLLFNLMTHFDFTNYPEEWWHYDLGNCLWAEILKIPWLFGSMEGEVTEIEKNQDEKT